MAPGGTACASRCQYSKRPMVWDPFHAHRCFSTVLATRRGVAANPLTPPLPPPRFRLRHIDPWGLCTNCACHNGPTSQTSRLLYLREGMPIMMVLIMYSQTIPHQLLSIHILAMDNASSSGRQSRNTHPAAWPDRCTRQTDWDRTNCSAACLWRSMCGQTLQTESVSARMWK